MGTPGKRCSSTARVSSEFGQDSENDLSNLKILSDQIGEIASEEMSVSCAWHASGSGACVQETCAFSQR